MALTKKAVAQQLYAYLQHDISLGELVDWAENALLEGDFSAKDFEALNDVLGRIGLADSRAFGLAWGDCENLMQKLGYSLRIEIAETA